MWKKRGKKRDLQPLHCCHLICIHVYQFSFLYMLCVKMVFCYTAASLLPPDLYTCINIHLYFYTWYTYRERERERKRERERARARELQLFGGDRIMGIYAYMCIYICIYVRVHTFLCMCVHMCSSLQIHMYMYTWRKRDFGYLDLCCICVCLCVCVWCAVMFCSWESKVCVCVWCRGWGSDEKGAVCGG